MMDDLKKILLIEDNADDAELTIMALRSKKVVNDIKWISDSEEALKYLEVLNYSEEALPVMILLDLKMPKLNGFDVMQKVKQLERIKIIPIVIFTSSNEDSDLLSSYQNGANSYIQKPVKAEDFERIVKKIGLYWAVVNQMPDQ